MHHSRGVCILPNALLLRIFQAHNSYVLAVPLREKKIVIPFPVDIPPPGGNVDTVSVAIVSSLNENGFVLIEKPILLAKKGKKYKRVV